MQIKNFSFNSSGTVDCEIAHPVYGWIPFTASPDDVEELGKTLYQEILKSGEEIIPYTPPIVDDEAVLQNWRSSTEVSRFQAMAALYQGGYLDAVEAYMASTTDKFVVLAWNNAQVFKRNSTTVMALQAVLELSDEQIDDLFKNALEVTA